MNLVRLIYASRFTEHVGPNDIQAILSVSRENNQKNDITGVLCYDPNFFLQCLEGDRKNVSILYNAIVHDHRHKDVVILEFSEIESRVYENWSMAYVRLDELTTPILEKYETDSVFDPYHMKSEKVLDFIKEIAEERHNFLEEEKQKLT